MTRDEIRSAVVQALLGVAPEAQESELRPDEPLREQLEIDSFDFLQFVIALNKKPTRRDRADLHVHGYA